MVLHAVHNGLLLAVVYWKDELAARGIGVEETSHLPVTWLAGAAAAVITAIAILAISTRPAEARPQRQLAEG